MKRDQLVSRARALAPEDGFVLDSGHAIPTVKKALSILAKDALIESPRVGWWRIARIPNGAPVDKPPLDQATPVEDNAGPGRSVAIEREIGSGPESVYVYYHDAYADLARRNGLSAWECKVGSTFGEPDARVIGQGALTAFPRPPVIGLVIRTQNGRNLERALHVALTLAGKRVDCGGGTEWFITSPDQVERWVCVFFNSLTIFTADQNSAMDLNSGCLPVSTSRK